MQTANIEEELERLLASKAFSRAGRLRRFLEYVAPHVAGDPPGQKKKSAFGPELMAVVTVNCSSLDKRT
jgi:hypothetical protein